MRKDLEVHVRGVLKTFGICMKSVGRRQLRQDFRDQLTRAGQHDAAIGLMAEMFNPIHAALCAAAETMDEELKSIAREGELARRLMTVPPLAHASICCRAAGVGPIVALSFIATIDDAGRFQKSKDIGAYLGLTPRRHQSGEVDWSGRISRCGDRDLRRRLYSAATTLITQVRKTSPLQQWATQLYEKTGVKKAAVARARKIAVMRHCIWRDGTPFDPNIKAFV